MRPDTYVVTRRRFVARFGGLLAMLAIRRGDAFAAPVAGSSVDHPDPRPGITAQRVLADDALGGHDGKKMLAAYDAARRYPATFDGIACGCGCGGKDAPHRSLLVCYETLQPTGCIACQTEAELVGRMAAQEAPLAEIRAAVDKRFG